MVCFILIIDFIPGDFSLKTVKGLGDVVNLKYCDYQGPLLDGFAKME